MNETIKDALNANDGMALYEYIVNNAETGLETPDLIVARMKEIDNSGQFLCSTARFLATVDRNEYEPQIEALVDAAIDTDKDRKYIGSLLEALWGPDFKEHIDELRVKDDRFRRIYKRIYQREV